MPVLTKTKSASKVLPKNRAIERVDEEEDVETKEEPEAKTIVSKGLAKLVTEWTQAVGKADSYFPKICQFVLEEGTEKKELKKALMEIRGMAKLTAGNEVSVIMRVIDYPDEIQKAIDGEITVRELRDIGKEEHEGKDDPETKLEKGIKRMASFAIKELEMDQPDFLAQCKSAYKDRHAAAVAAEAKKAAAEEAGEETGEEDENEEEE
jgi:hypothetical protein